MSESFWPQDKILCETVKYCTTEHQAEYPLKKQYWKKVSGKQSTHHCVFTQYLFYVINSILCLPGFQFSLFVSVVMRHVPLYVRDVGAA